MGRDISKRLSWLLRHGAPTAGVTLDAAGWADVGAVLDWLGVRPAALEEAVATNGKRRLQLDGDRVRCCQGHSLGVGVTLDALELSWTRWAGEGPLWHGTALAAVSGIAAGGIRAQRRTHVHLASDLESRVGKRANVAVMLEVEPARLRAAGQIVFEAPNGVVLTRFVPADCVVDLRAMSRAARRQEADLRALMGW